tara:strand:+ start:257 stop:475 length:219 start_codon:yes stop_codon:yes gene_type:complete
LKIKDIINMMYLILKERHYSNIENSYDIVASSKDIDVINDKLKGYQLINDDKNETYTIVRYESPLLLNEEVA